MENHSFPELKRRRRLDIYLFLSNKYQKTEKKQSIIKILFFLFWSSSFLSVISMHKLNPFTSTVLSLDRRDGYLKTWTNKSKL